MSAIMKCFSHLDSYFEHFSSSRLLFIKHMPIQKTDPSLYQVLVGKRFVYCCGNLYYWTRKDWTELDWTTSLSYRNLMTEVFRLRKLVFSNKLIRKRTLFKISVELNVTSNRNDLITLAFSIQGYESFSIRTAKEMDIGTSMNS
jgi:hypothetical protein